MQLSLLLTLLVPSIAFADRLQPSDLVYRGAFRLPDDFNWGARGLSYYPLGSGGAGSLLVTGFEGLLKSDGTPCEGAANCKAYYGEVSIPTPQQEAQWQDLPTAGFLKSMTDFDGGLIQGPSNRVCLCFRHSICVPPGEPGQ